MNAIWVGPTLLLPDDSCNNLAPGASPLSPCVNLVRPPSCELGSHRPTWLLAIRTAQSLGINNLTNFYRNFVNKTEKEQCHA